MFREGWFVNDRDRDEWPSPELLAELPRSAHRLGRVALIAEAAELLLHSGTECGAFLGAALRAWLRGDGDSLERHLRVAPPQGSHRKPQHLYRRLTSGEAPCKAKTR
jgi:hypothetical protein